MAIKTIHTFRKGHTVPGVLLTAANGLKPSSAIATEDVSFPVLWRKPSVMGNKDHAEAVFQAYDETGTYIIEGLRRGVDFSPSTDGGTWDAQAYVAAKANDPFLSKGEDA